MLSEEDVHVILEGAVADVLFHVFVKVMGQVGLDKTLELMLRHHVISVPFDSVLTWVGVIVHCLVDEDTDVHGHGVPTSVLIINDNEVTVVLHGHEDVVLVAIVMGKHIGEGVAVGAVKMSWLVRLWNNAFKIGLVVFE